MGVVTESFSKPVLIRSNQLQTRLNKLLDFTTLHMKHLLLILSFLLPFVADCEPCFEEGMRWTSDIYDSTTPTMAVGAREVIYLEGDTILKDKNALKMFEIAESNQLPQLISAVHEEDSKIWYWDLQTNEWYLAYDFNLKVGEGCYVYNIKMRTKEDLPQCSYIKCVGIKESGDYVFIDFEEYLYGEEYAGFPPCEGYWIKNVGSPAGVLYNNIVFSYTGIWRKLVEACNGDNVIYEYKKSDIADADFIPMKITTNANGLVISGLNAVSRSMLHVYTIEGVLVGHYNTVGDDISIELPGHGVYVVAVGHKLAKIRF